MGLNIVLMTSQWAHAVFPISVTPNMPLHMTCSAKKYCRLEQEVFLNVVLCEQYCQLWAKKALAKALRRVLFVISCTRGPS